MRMPIIVLAFGALALAAAMAGAPPAMADVKSGGALDFGSIALPPAPQPPRDAQADAATYERCMALARKDPAAARKLAQEWRGRGGGHPAEHCDGVALIGLKQY